MTVLGFLRGRAMAYALAGARPNILLRAIKRTPDSKIFSQKEQCPIQELTLETLRAN